MLILCRLLWFLMLIVPHYVVLQGHCIKPLVAWRCYYPLAVILLKVRRARCKGLHFWDGNIVVSQNTFLKTAAPRNIYCRTCRRTLAEKLVGAARAESVFLFYKLQSVSLLFCFGVCVCVVQKKKGNLSFLPLRLIYELSEGTFSSATFMIKYLL